MSDYFSLGIDTGGTFTDFVLLKGDEISVYKVLSTPDDPSKAILQGISELQLLSEVSRGRVTVIHGSTVATNAALERKGVRTVYVANKGLKDVLTLARQTRPELYNLTPDPVEPPVPEALCLEVDCRLNALGDETVGLTDESISDLIEAINAQAPESVAINLLYSFLNDEQERRIESALPAALFVSRSSFVLPEYKEYERGIATWLNAWLGPKMDFYLRRLANELSGCAVSMMQSSGGTIELAQAAKRTVNLLLSGPAGGLAAARYIGEQIGESRFITFDMGGTSTDVALIDGNIRLTNEGSIGPWPVAVPMVDMHTIGAGGGSLAWVDEGGMLQVGPQSAGATPGPACYGQGGGDVTVTDANLLLGRLRSDAFLGGDMSLDADAAESAMSLLAGSIELSLMDTAEGVVSVANEHMTRALRAISIQKGYNPAEFRLCCFGGAGGLHVCALADAMKIHKAIIPVHGGVLSAMGMLVAPRERQLSHTFIRRMNDVDETQLWSLFDEMAARGRYELEEEKVDITKLSVSYSVDVRYQGQSFTINLPWSGPSELIEQFHIAHQQRYGHALERSVEMVNLRVSVTAPGIEFALQKRESGLGLPDTYAAIYGYQEKVPIYSRSALKVGETLIGPLLIVENVSTTLVEGGWRVLSDEYGNLLLSRC